MEGIPKTSGTSEAGVCALEVIDICDCHVRGMPVALGGNKNFLSLVQLHFISHFTFPSLLCQKLRLN